MLPVPQADVEQEAAEEFELAVVDNPNSGRDRDELMFLNTELVDQVHAPDQYCAWPTLTFLVEVCYHEGGAGSDLSAMIVQEYSQIPVSYWST